MKRRASSVRWGLEQAAAEFGINPRTLSGNLRRGSIEAGEDSKFSTAQICAAIFGDKAGEDLRKVREEADKLALHNSKARGSLVEVEAAFRHYQGVFVALRQRILGSSLSDKEKDDLLNNMTGLTYEEAKRNGIAESPSDDDGDAEATA